MRVIVYMQIAHVSPTRAGTHAWESVQTCRLLLIGQSLVGVQTGLALMTRALHGRARLKATLTILAA